MGVLNVTPDSFSDGGAFTEPARAVEHALTLRDQGADILDLGGESSRPGASAVSAQEELDRVGPVLEGLQNEGLVVSIDTTKAAVARHALALGASIINDISGLTRDPAMLVLAAQSGAGLAVMHMQGCPESMQKAPTYRDVVREVGDFFEARLKELQAGGVKRECIALDPGIGFGKTVDHNLELLAGLGGYKKLNRPLLVGLSRKRFLGILTGKEVHHRLFAGLGATAYAITRGAHIVRVHDVAEVKDAVTLIDALRKKETELGIAETDSSC
jgi:dihydropteroate synthase